MFRFRPFRFALMLFVVVASAHFRCSEAKAGPVLPTTPAGEAAAAYLDAFNGGDAQAYANFVRQNWPSNREPPDQAWFMRDQSGGFDLVKIEASTDTSLIGIVRGRLSDNYVRFVLHVDAAAPHVIKTMLLAQVPRPADAPAPPRQGWETLKPLIEARLRATPDFSGVLLVAEHGQPVLTETRGYADRAAGVPNRLDTPFRIASMTKMFTAVAVVQLAQAGKLSFDAPVGEYLKDYPNAVFARTVTIRELLNHTAGAGESTGPSDADRAPEFTPGSRYSYSNYGYVVLGRIIEVVSGESYKAYVAEHIFRPAGMSHSGYEPRPSEGTLALGYVKGPRGISPGWDVSKPGASSAGGAYSTAPDLLAFANALSERRLLDAEHTALITTGTVQTERSARYAFGFFDYTVSGLRDFGHDGGNPGFNGDLRILGDGNAVIVVLSNVGPPPRAMQLSGYIAARLDPDQP